MKHLAVALALLGALAWPALAGDADDGGCRLLQDANIALGIMLRREQSERTILKARLIREYLLMCEKAKVDCNAEELWDGFS